MKPKTWFKSEEETARDQARLIKDEKERDIALAGVDLKYGHITNNDHVQLNANVCCSRNGAL